MQIKFISVNYHNSDQRFTLWKIVLINYRLVNYNFIGDTNHYCFQVGYHRLTSKATYLIETYGKYLHSGKCLTLVTDK